MVRTSLAALVVCSLMGLAVPAAAQTAAPAPAAQPPAAAPAPAQASGRGARMIERMCGAPVKQQSGKSADRLAERLSLNDAQKKALADWQDARQKSRETTRSTLCSPKPDLSTFAGRMAFREKRLETRLASFKATRPSMEAFYASLDDRQRALWDEAREQRREERRRGRRHDRD
jgi:hypothetical protein